MFISSDKEDSEKLSVSSLEDVSVKKRIESPVIWLQEENKMVSED